MHNLFENACINTLIGKVLVNLTSSLSTFEMNVIHFQKYNFIVF